jgi:hypothetical protein
MGIQPVAHAAHGSEDLDPLRQATARCRGRAVCGGRRSGADAEGCKARRRRQQVAADQGDCFSGQEGDGAWLRQATANGGPEMEVRGRP